MRRSRIFGDDKGIYLQICVLNTVALRVEALEHTVVSGERFLASSVTAFHDVLTLLQSGCAKILRIRIGMRGLLVIR